ncbi:hypothetical protein LSTR_LSTR007041 [Laodelphax striatellus]|uniref:Uncharacterized protein n=1 Tax=Laodelphax striatellus TaxID=195883 RepID=A0A482WJK7_LAOST|nr:hypothetical protein LSTR_LSTR007041 [Laodelphax striatellus]
MFFLTPIFAQLPGRATKETTSFILALLPLNSRLTILVEMEKFLIKKTEVSDKSELDNKCKLDANVPSNSSFVYDCQQSQKCDNEVQSRLLFAMDLPPNDGNDIRTFIRESVFPIEETDMDVPPPAPQGTIAFGTNALHLAAQHNHTEVAHALLRAGISCIASNKVERTPLHVAAQEGHYEIVKLLIEYGADVDCEDMMGNTPLHWAAEKGDTKVLNLLLKSGANPNVENVFDLNPDDIALKKGRLDVVEILQKSCRINPLFRSAMKKLSVRRETVNDKKTINKQRFDNGQKKISPHSFTRVLVNRKTGTINKLPPTPPVDVSKSSDFDKLEAELIEVARNQGVFMDDDDDPLHREASEAGKLAFNSTKDNLIQNRNVCSGGSKGPGNLQVVRTKPPTTIQCKKVPPVGTEQLINMIKHKKVIIHKGDKSQGKPVQFVCTKPMDQASAVKLGIISMNNTNASKQNETNCFSSSPAKKPRTEESPDFIQMKKRRTSSPHELSTIHGVDSPSTS